MPVSPSNITIDSVVSENSTNPVQNGAIYSFLTNNFYTKEEFQEAVAAIVERRIRTLKNDLISVIPSYIFAGASSLYNVDVQNCTTIKNYAFNQSGLVTITAPSVESVEAYAFSSCSVLQTVDFAGEVVGSLDYRAFADAYRINHLYLGGDSVWTIKNNKTFTDLVNSIQGSGHQVTMPFVYVPADLLNTYKYNSSWGNGVLAGYFAADTR